MDYINVDALIDEIEQLILNNKLKTIEHDGETAVVVDKTELFAIIEKLRIPAL